MGHLKSSLALLFLMWITCSVANLDRCFEKGTCHECIQTSNCAWCSMPKFDDRRCFPQDIASKCPKNYTVNPRNEYIEIRSKELTKLNYTELNSNDNSKGDGISSNQEAVQIFPQEISLKLRINEVQKIKIVAQAEDYTALKLKHTANNYFNLVYTSNCLGDGPFKHNGQNVCGSKVEFIVEVMLRACSENPAEWKQQFLLRPVGIANASLTVNLEMICDCNCDQGTSLTGTFEPNSTKCSGQGNFTCGVCSCNEDYYGESCECERAFAVSSGCRPDNSSIDCSGRGVCECNLCYCSKTVNPEEMLVYGPFCECDNFSCQRSGGLMCSGHGFCSCGECFCLKNWAGSACECNTDTKDCFDEVTKLECSGHGSCNCGKCKCHSEDEHQYSGKLCNVTIPVQLP